MDEFIGNALPPRVLPLLPAGVLAFLMILLELEGFCSLAEIPRDRDAADFFAGAAGVTSAFSFAAMFAEPYEIDKWPGIPFHDFLSLEGFAIALIYVLRLRRGGLCIAGWDCSSWGFMNLSNTKRELSNGYMGDRSYWPARKGNEMFRRTLVLFEVVMHRGCFFLGENPGDSKFEKTKLWADWLASHPSVVRIHMYMRPYGHTMDKATILISNMPWLPSLAWPFSRSHARRMETSGWYINDKGQVCGMGDGLRASAAYVPLFCANLVHLFSRHDLLGHDDARVRCRQLCWSQVCGLIREHWLVDQFMAACDRFAARSTLSRHIPVRPELPSGSENSEGSASPDGEDNSDLPKRARLSKPHGS